MSDIHKDLGTDVSRLINGIDRDDRSGSLQAPWWMEVALDEAKVSMAMDVIIDGMLVPRYGVLSLLARSTPFFVYGHPALKKLCKTAFTDGLHVFVSDTLFEKLIQEEDKANGTEEGLVPLMMHELMHKLFNHTKRLRAFPSDVANIATDLSINTRLQKGFPEIKWVPSLRETGLGFAPGEMERYLELSEESIARDIMQERLKNPPQKPKPGDQPGDQKGQGSPQPGQGKAPGQQGSPGSGQPGQGQAGPPQPGQSGKPQPGQGQSGAPGGDEAAGGSEPADGFGEEGDNHLIDLPTLIKVLEEAGLTEALAKMGLPSSDDVEGIGAVEDEATMRQVEAVQKAASQLAQMGNGKYPGAHIVDCAADMVRGFTKGKLSWRLALRELIFGDGDKHRSSMEEPSSVYYVDEVTGTLGTELYLPVELPFKSQETVLVLVDTSGSVSEADLRAFYSEIFELKTASQGFGDSASEVIVLSADTVLRGEPIEITDANVDELLQTGIKAHGRGGTDLGHSLAQAVNLPMMKEKNIKAVIYMTDLYDRIPQYKDLGLKTDDVTIVYVAAPTTGSQHVAEFAKGVESYARVVEIEEGLEVDLSETSMDMPVVSPQKSRKPGF